MWSFGKPGFHLQEGQMQHPDLFNGSVLEGIYIYTFQVGQSSMHRAGAKELRRELQALSCFYHLRTPVFT